jgi:hypothetical protein
MVDGRCLVTFVPAKRDLIPAGTLSDILSQKQTRIGKKGLAALLDTYGLPKNSPLK